MNKRPYLFPLALVLLLALGAWQCRDGLPISFDLMALLPQQQDAPLRKLAQQRTQQPLARQMLALIEADSTQALATAQLLAQRWRASGLFSQVELELAIDLASLREQLRSQRLSLLPQAIFEQLQRQPESYLKQRAAELAAPFSLSALVPISQDWLGLSRHAQSTLQTPPGSALSYDPASGTLQIEQAGKTAILLRAQTQSDAFAVSPSSQSLVEQIQQDRAVLAQLGAQLSVAGGPLYAEAGKEQAIAEISLIGSLSMAGIVLLLLRALRRLRALLALLPVLVGLVCGFVLCVAVFGSIHILTLVIGTSLIGVAVDFPLHWLSKSYAGSWQARPALRLVLPALTMSLMASLIGYLALLFTPFIALSQTAVFAAGGLFGAFACTALQLPAWFERFAPRPWPPLLHLAQTLLKLRQIKPRVLLMLALPLLLGTLGGLQRLSLHDDLRQWLTLPKDLLQQAQIIGEQTGLMPTSQFFLVQAPDEDSLLQRQAQLAGELDQLVQRGELGAYNALSQLLAPVALQRSLQNELAGWAENPQLLQPLLDLGIPLAALQAELASVQQLPPVSIDSALQGTASERWRSLWLGQYQGQSAALVTLFNLSDVAALNAVAEAIPGVSLIDQSGELNQLFSATRVKAGELKLLSYLAAALLLWWGLGRAAVWRILAVPLLGAVLSLAVLGWLGQPLTLFSLFGLLLVSALGVDYAIFMYQGAGGAAVSFVSVLLSAATTLLSFGLLSLSQTPVLAGFGLTVALGVGFSLLLSLWVCHKGNLKYAR
ncbi:hypothetical protein AXE65_05210 [Ventosimonas gracilis]|uniref:Membrane transport protein MMPL domain-containing protein n=1 Tax=Ventosimonas gracilis TaxID=1680762 RepID=A0A139SP01_9GAMM|nr:hypothetical protein [Ventosimonas gracilis]KXU36287.1 hypothetical protein AXE65_05210 [Ventosimonas gracilis]